MLQAMRQLALDWVQNRLDGQGDPEQWYRQARETDMARLFQYLVERVETGEGGEAPSAGKGPRKQPQFYTISEDLHDPETAVLEVHDLRPGLEDALPFNQASGPQSPALGPVLKRGWKAAEKVASPTPNIQRRTLEQFAEIGRRGEPWSAYFAEAAACLSRPRLRVAATGEVLVAGKEGHALGLALQAIPGRETVRVAYRDPAGRLPGQVPEYVKYLQQVLALTKYAAATKPRENSTCPLCGAQGITVYPNALSGAGINLANMDRDGAFPGVDPEQAWKGYALCVGCADLLYIYKFHVAREYLVRVAGERAVVIPFTPVAAEQRRQFARRMRQFVDAVAGEEVIRRENRLIRALADDTAVTSLTFVWAGFGQAIDDVKGMVTDVLPSRLRALAEKNREVSGAIGGVFCAHPLPDFRYDLRLSVVAALLERPGGRKARTANESKRLFDLKRDLAAAIYHQQRAPDRLWPELMETARWHLADAAERGDAWGLIYEGYSEKKQTAFLTLAGWVRELARFLWYLRKAGVMQMPKEIYQPQSEALKPFFTPESAIDSREKAFAFILGALYGKVMQVQAARGVNVGANALTWLKRLTLSGKDLPELYIKVREKLLAYETEGSPTVRELVSELGVLGSQIGDQPDLDNVSTCYYLLLGQSLATTIMPSKADTDT